MQACGMLMNTWEFQTCLGECADKNEGMKTKNILLGLALGCLATSGHAAEWAVGAGLGSLGYNVYPGSKDHQVYPVLPPTSSTGASA